MLHNYVISLPQAEERRQHIRNEFDAKNIPFKFFDALQPSFELQQHIVKILPRLQDEPNMTDGEKACLMSHLSLWQKCLEEDLPYIAIFEDDIVLGSQAEKFLIDTLWLEQRFANDAYFLCLETVLRLINLKSTGIQEYQGRQFKFLESSNSGCGAYIISNQAIRLLLQKIHTLSAYDLNPVDVLVYDYLNNIPKFSLYQLTPALCIQDSVLNKQKGLVSQLEKDRFFNFNNLPKKKKRKKFSERIQHVLLKPIRMIKKVQRQRVLFL
ncbi:glycosyltransferase family 25 protein [Neisseria sp. S1]|uniref:glycosyltransferase family 25 protein n=1 Tax=Neisseria sp. S1 TaxID=3318354 RepID=UPI003A8B3ED2